MWEQNKVGTHISGVHVLKLERLVCIHVYNLHDPGQDVTVFASISLGVKRNYNMKRF